MAFGQLKKIFLKDPINDSRIHDGDILGDARDEQRIAGQDRGLREELGGIQLTIFPMMNRGEHHWDLVQTTVLVFYVRKTR